MHILDCCFHASYHDILLLGLNHSTHSLHPLKAHVKGFRAWRWITSNDILIQPTGFNIGKHLYQLREKWEVIFFIVKITSHDDNPIPHLSYLNNTNITLTWWTKKDQILSPLIHKKFLINSWCGKALVSATAPRPEGSICSTACYSSSSEDIHSYWHRNLQQVTFMPVILLQCHGFVSFIERWEDIYQCDEVVLNWQDSRQSHNRGKHEYMNREAPIVNFWSSIIYRPISFVNCHLPFVNH